MKRLTRIANSCNTDKGSTCGDMHCYTEFYEPYFEKYEAPNILELGTYEGGSARMFSKFYDDNCKIWTCDIYDGFAESVSGLPNAKFFTLDLENKEEIKKLHDYFVSEGIEFDIVIDDASHAWRHQMNALCGFHDLVKKDGIYIIEDLNYSLIWSDPENSPLYFLNFLSENVMLTNEEYSELKNKIENVTIFNRRNEATDSMRERFGGRSITSIITFEK